MYPDIDYINEIVFYSFEIFKKVRKRKQLNDVVVNEMISLAISLLNILELYLNDESDYLSMKKQKIPSSVSSLTNKPTLSFTLIYVENNAIVRELSREKAKLRALFSVSKFFWNKYIISKILFFASIIIKFLLILWEFIL